MTIVRDAVMKLKSYGSMITDYIMKHGHNVDIVVSKNHSVNPTLVIFPRQVIPKITTKEMNEESFHSLNVGEDDEKYIEVSLK